MARYDDTLSDVMWVLSPPSNSHHLANCLHSSGYRRLDNGITSAWRHGSTGSVFAGYIQNRESWSIDTITPNTFGPWKRKPGNRMYSYMYSTKSGQFQQLQFCIELNRKLCNPLFHFFMKIIWWKYQSTLFIYDSRVETISTLVALVYSWRMAVT